MIRVDSSVELDDQMSTTCRMKSRRKRLNERRYGIRARVEFRTSFVVAGSVKVDRRCNNEALCDLSRGVRVPYFSVSVDRRL